MLPSFIAIPKHLARHYIALRIALYSCTVLIAAFAAYRVIFPVLPFSFDFKNPNSSKNSILAPRSDTGTLRENGKIEADGILIADLSATGTFSQADIEATLENKSALPQALSFSIRRSYRSFLLPTGPTISNFAKESLYHIGDTYYALRDGSLHPFVSEAAYLSRYPASFAVAGTDDLLKKYPVSEDWIGFRIGSLVSFADGIFVIVSDTEMRPIGSADIFLALGYHFENVISGSEEELGIYKRGRILLLGATHPDGTLFLDQDTHTYYLIDQGFKRPIADASYRDFLITKQVPILASSQAGEIHADCTLKPSFIGRTFSCSTPIDALTPGFGNDFEIRLSQNDAAIDINSLTVSLSTAKSGQNMFTVFSQIKQRLLARFGNGG